MSLLTNLWFSLVHRLVDDLVIAGVVCLP